MTIEEKIENGNGVSLELLQSAAEDVLPKEFVRKVNGILWKAASEGRTNTVVDIREYKYLFKDPSAVTDPLKIPDTAELVKLYYQRRGLNARSLEDAIYDICDDDDEEEEDEVQYIRNISTIVFDWSFQLDQEPVYK